MKEEDINNVTDDKVKSILEKLMHDVELTEEEKSILEIVCLDLKYLSEAPDINKVWAEHMKKLPINRKNRFIKLFSTAAAIAAVLIGVYFLRVKDKKYVSNQDSSLVTLSIESDTSNKREINIINLQKDVYKGVVKKDSIIEYADTTNLYENEYHKLSVGQGVRYIVKLSDGTVVNLNSNSYIRYPMKFTGGVREVELSGEAFFKVAKDNNKPFIVRCGTFRVDVIGTSFNIMNYEEEPIPKVSLTEGCLQVSRNNDKHILHPGEQAVLYADKIEIKSVDINHYRNNNNFTFSEDSFGYIARSLTRWYGVNFKFEEYDIANMLYTGTIPKHKDVVKVIETLELTTDIQILREDANTYIIRKPNKTKSN